MRSRLLIVDDNPQFLDAAKDLLERQGLDVVGVASTGAEAMRLAGELRPDCILVDVDLGSESGIQLAGLLGADHGPRVVLVSAYSESEFADLIAASSAVGFISKSELSARRIADVLDRAGPSPS
jgi:DNA-binding NarL/FixJ family response regulator